jgi:hypothetical protein
VTIPLYPLRGSMLDVWQDISLAVTDVKRYIDLLAIIKDESASSSFI